MAYWFATANAVVFQGEWGGIPDGDLTLFEFTGAYAFMAIETPQEEHRYLVKRLRAKDIEDTINYVAQLFWYEKHQNITEKQWDKRVSGLEWSRLVNLAPLM